MKVKNGGIGEKEVPEELFWKILWGALMIWVIDEVHKCQDGV